MEQDCSKRLASTSLCCGLMLLVISHITSGAITFRGPTTFQVSTIQPVTFQVTADSDINDAVVVYSLSSVSPLAVEDDVMIHMTTGLLSVESILESEAGVGGFILITVTATETNVSSGTSAVQTYFATVVDTAVEGNEAPVFSSNSYIFTISENVMDADEIDMLTVTDDDGFPTLELSDYSNTFGFTPGTATLIVTNAERVDFDTMRRFEFTVTATDVLDSSLVSNATVTVNLIDYNDLSPVIHNDGERVVVEDNTTAMVELITVDVTDGDEPNTLNSEVTLTITDDVGLFMVMDHTISTSRALNGAIGEYNITIVARDGGTPQQTSMAMFIIDIVNTNYHSPMLDLEEYIVDVPEDTNSGDIILTVTATDGDDPASPAGQIANFTITGSDSIYFRIAQNVTNNTNFIGNVILKTLDYEVIQMYDYTVTATDNGAIPRHSMPASHVIINVTDVNDNPPVFQQPNYNFIVAEESNVGLIIGMVSASDNDSGLNALLTYCIISAMPNGSFFRINNQTGEICTLSSLDRKQYSRHLLEVVAVDQGLPALTGLTTVSIEIGGGGRSSAPVIGGSLGGVAFLFIIIFISCTMILYIRRKKRLQRFDNRMGTNANVNMIANPCYNYVITKRDEHQYDYVLPQSVQHSILDMYRRGQGHNTSNGATGTQPIEEFTGDGEDVDEDGYLQLYSHNSQRADYKVTGDGYDTDYVTMIPNPCYEEASQGVKLQDNPSYNKITYM